MRALVSLWTAVLLLAPVIGQAQTLQDVEKARGAANLKSIEIQGMKSFARLVRENPHGRH